MTAVIYARYSSDNQREESIEGQIRECTAYAEKNGITIVKHYIDRAISAKTDNRPEFQQMIKDSDKKLFDIVLVWKLDRFARNRYDSARYKTQLKKNGVKLMSATEIISEGPEGIILESVLEGYAEYYSADLAEKVVRGQTENILKGRCNGGRGTFGYTLDSERKFHIDPLTSPFVLESFKKYNEGSTMKEIRDWLNENGIKNPVGGAFTYNSVEHMLKNRRYIGELKFRDVVVPDAIPPIIPLELSIWEDGFTMPCVCYYDREKDNYILVDGYHRYQVLKTSKRIYQRENGLLPVVVIDKELSNRMASTIRHNRARGTHNIELMCHIVAELDRAGMSDEWIMKNIGMDRDEVLRLKQISGLADLFANKNFSIPDKKEEYVADK